MARTLATDAPLQPEANDVVQPFLVPPSPAVAPSAGEVNRDLDGSDRDPFHELEVFQEQEEAEQEMLPDDFLEEPAPEPVPLVVLQLGVAQGAWACPGLHVREFPRRGDHICVGGARLHASHQLRYSRNWLWCLECGAYSAGGTSKLLFRSCGGSQRRTRGTAKHSWKRLCGNDTPLRRLVFADGAQGFGKIVSDSVAGDDVSLALVEPPGGHALWRDSL